MEETSRILEWVTLVTTHPLVVVHLGAWIIVHYTKHTLGYRISSFLSGGCSPNERIRKIVTISWATIVTFILSIFYWPGEIIPLHLNKYSMAFINSLFNPFIFFVTMKLLEKSERTKFISDFFGYQEEKIK